MFTRQKFALLFGCLLGLLHYFFAIAVDFFPKIWQPIINLICRLHCVQPVFSANTPTRFCNLYALVITFLFGYLIGLFVMIIKQAIYGDHYNDQ